MTAIIEKDARLVSRLRAGLLNWYDRHRRDLPWRRGARDSYRVWLSEVMLQQTTTVHAAPYYSRFLELWPTVADLAAAPDEQVMAEWAGLGYYSRARNLIKCARAVVDQHGGHFPANEAELLKLPGLGAYTAAAVAAIAFDQPANVIDSNIERIVARLYAIDTPLPEARSPIRLAAQQWVLPERAGDWPQALMDLSAAICRPKAPLCLLCPLQDGCAAFASGKPELYPVKAAKAVKPQRYGIAFLIVGEDGFIAERRADKGLLGGMLGIPHTPWRDMQWTAVEADPPLPEFLPVGQYSHVFTHFALEQAVWRREATAAEIAALLRAHNDWQLVPFAQEKSLPTVFRKALVFA
ncbi:MAG: A/G-specific adenine glycosylase [Asticcacaulis sp.]|nr:A/G-specific adenine glycosylase [Asticcacaulis sp.]